MAASGRLLIASFFGLACRTDADGYAVALQAGNDLICVDSQVLNQSFKDGRISEEDLDTAVRRALLARRVGKASP